MLFSKSTNFPKLLFAVIRILRFFLISLVIRMISVCFCGGRLHPICWVCRDCAPAHDHWDHHWQRCKRSMIRLWGPAAYVRVPLNQIHKYQMLLAMQHLFLNYFLEGEQDDYKTVLCICIIFNPWFLLHLNSALVCLSCRFCFECSVPPCVFSLYFHIWFPSFWLASYVWPVFYYPPPPPWI